MVRAPAAVVRWKSADETPSAPRRHSAPCAPSSHMPEGATPTFPFLRALFALVVRPRRARRTDPLEPRALGARRGRVVAAAVDVCRPARLGPGDAAPGRSGAAHHARTCLAAVAGPAIGPRRRRLAGGAGEVRADAGRHLPGS